MTLKGKRSSLKSKNFLREREQCCRSHNSSDHRRILLIFRYVVRFNTNKTKNPLHTTPRPPQTNPKLKPTLPHTKNPPHHHPKLHHETKNHHHHQLPLAPLTSQEALGLIRWKCQILQPELRLLHSWSKILAQFWKFQTMLMRAHRDGTVVWLDFFGLCDVLPCSKHYCFPSSERLWPWQCHDNPTRLHDFPVQRWGWCLLSYGKELGSWNI